MFEKLKSRIADIERDQAQLKVELAEVKRTLWLGEVLMLMKRLELQIEYQGRTLRQLKRIGTVAIYEVRNKAETLYGYEVAMIKVTPAGEKFGKLYPERELYPSSSKNSDDWGTIAWSFGRNFKKEALAAFNGLVRKQSKPAIAMPEGV